MKIASCILILPFFVHLNFVELSSPEGSSRRHRSRSPHRIQLSSNQSSRVTDQSVLNSSSPENYETLTLHDVTRILNDLGPPEHSYGRDFGHHTSMPSTPAGHNNQHHQLALRPHGTMVATESNAQIAQNPIDTCYMPGCTGDIYLQKPGNHILRGNLIMEWYRNGVPSWMNLQTGYEINDSTNRVFLHKPGWDSTFLKSDIRVNVPTPYDHNILRYKCFVKNEHGLFSADLVRLPLGKRIDLHPILTTTIYVLMPESKLVYMGELKPYATHLAPRWINL